MAADPLSDTFAALADPTRRSILSLLVDGEKTVTELAAPFDITMPAITKHLKVLERAGLIARSRQAQARPCALRPEGFRDAAHWIEAYRALWEARFDRLDAYLEELQSKGEKSNAGRTKRRKR